MRRKIVNAAALVLYGFLAACIGGFLVEKAQETQPIATPAPAPAFWDQFADAPQYQTPPTTVVRRQSIAELQLYEMHRANEIAEAQAREHRLEILRERLRPEPVVLNFDQINQQYQQQQTLDRIAWELRWPNQHDRH